MSPKFASLLKVSAAGFVLISVGACKPADKGQGALKSESVKALNLSKSEASVFAKYFDVGNCEVDEMEALGALAGLGLGESGTNGLQFQSRDFDAGRVIYKDMLIKADDDNESVFKAKSVIFHCPAMGDDAPGFDRLDLSDASLSNDEINFTFGSLNIAKPTTDAARAIVSGMLKPDSSDPGDIGFEAVSMTDVTLKAEEVFGSLKALSWGEMRETSNQGKADLTIEDLELTVPGQNDAQDMTFDFKGMSARSLNIGGTLDANANLSANGMVSSVLGNLNALQKPYDQLIIESLKIDSEGFALDFGGIEGQTVEAGSVSTTRQTMKPTTLTFKPALAETGRFGRNYEILKSLGFETLKMSGSSVTALDRDADSITVSDGRFVVEDGFVLNFEYGAEGLNEMTQKLRENGGSSDPQNLLADYDALKLRNFRLTLEDNSIVERGLKLASEMTGQSEKNIKRSLGMAAFAAALAAENDVQAEVYTETTEAFADFIKNGGTLTIEANPPQPFSLAPLISGKGENVDPEALGFSATQESAPE